MASSSAMVPRGPREVTIAPVWEASTEGVSTDIEMAGTTNYTFTVPDFVASAVDSIQSQLRYFHAKCHGVGRDINVQCVLIKEMIIIVDHYTLAVRNRR
jgi:hypothetical protein